MLTGRKEQQEELRQMCESDRSEFAVIFGRRRVGKTFLKL
jgi:AAA+ ATPase superfamily predicted ATPase